MKDMITTAVGMTRQIVCSPLLLIAVVGSAIFGGSTDNIQAYASDDNDLYQGSYIEL